MSWFKREKPNGEGLPKVEDNEKRVRTEGLWQKCEGCRQIIWKKDLEANWNVCPKCGHHFPHRRRRRACSLLFDGDFEIFDDALRSSDPLHFVDKQAYRDKLRSTQAATNAGCADGGGGPLDGREVRNLRHGIRLHRRQHGMGGGGEDRARHRPLPCATRRR